MSLVNFFHLWHKTASSVEAGTAAVNSWVQSLPCPEGSISQLLSDLPSILFFLLPFSCSLRLGRGDTGVSLGL